jgi:hypothetical protein
MIRGVPHVGLAHSANQVLNFLTNAWSARSSVPGFVCPIPFEPSFVPVEDSSGACDFQEILPSLDQLRVGYPK